MCGLLWLCMTAQAFVVRQSVALPAAARAPAVRCGTWVDLGSCRSTVAAPPTVVFRIISDYPRWPEWSPWLSKVDLCEADDRGTTSRWFLRLKGIDVSWGSHVVELVPDSLVAWESTSGVRNSGSVMVVPDATDASSTLLTISLRYEIPAIIARLFSTAFVSSLVSSRLAADLKRFSAIAEREYGRGRPPSSGRTSSAATMCIPSDDEDNDAAADAPRFQGFAVWTILVWVVLPAALKAAGVQIPEHL